VARDAEALVVALGDFRRRPQAKRDLVAMGVEAEPALLAALDHPNEAIGWCAVKALEDIRSQAAVDPLIGLLTSGRGDATVISHALERITGESLGADIAAWQRYRGARTAAPEAPEAGKRPSKQRLVGNAIADTDMEIESARDGLLVTVPLKDGRRQRVRVLGANDPEGIPLLIFYTECGDCDPSRFEWALRKNLTIPYGAYGVRDIDGHAKFVMVQTLVRAYAKPSEIRSCIRAIAERGDSLESRLSSEDNL